MENIPTVTFLNFYLCIFHEIFGYYLFAYKLNRNADRILRMDKWREAQKNVIPLLDLEILKISSTCSERTLTFLLSQCINVKEIYMGMTTCISDQVWSDVFTNNSLSRLERLKIQKCSKVSCLAIFYYVYMYLLCIYAWHNTEKNCNFGTMHCLPQRLKSTFFEKKNSI